MRDIPSFLDWKKVPAMLEEYQLLNQERESWNNVQIVNDVQKIYWLSTRMDNIPDFFLTLQLVNTILLSPNPTYSIALGFIEKRLRQLRETASMKPTSVNSTDIFSSVYDNAIAQAAKQELSNANKRNTNIRCYNCGSLGHVQKDCQRSSVINQSNNKKSNQAAPLPNASFSNGTYKTPYRPNPTSAGKTSRPKSFNTEKWDNVKRRKLEVQMAALKVEELNSSLIAMCADIGINHEFEMEDVQEYQEDEVMPEETTSDNDNEYD
jgi:hypothetical protein